MVALECHGSLALLTGWELSRNSGARVAPLQKPNLDVWRPTESSERSATWAVETVEQDRDHDDVAICLSVTHDVHADVEAYLASADAPFVGRIVLVSPEGGPSPQSIDGADHAYQLASQLPGILASARPGRRARAHIFFACPNALMFFIGQQRAALGRLVLYEFRLRPGAGRVVPGLLHCPSRRAPATRPMRSKMILQSDFNQFLQDIVTSQ